MLGFTDNLSKDEKKVLTNFVINETRNLERERKMNSMVVGFFLGVSLFWVSPVLALLISIMLSYLFGKIVISKDIVAVRSKAYQLREG